MNAVSDVSRESTREPGSATDVLPACAMCLSIAVASAIIVAIGSGGQDMEEH
ncbi:MAG: hypothetical protein J4F49_00620 [Rhodobacteraceae bacterium]|nr:hypothetical protein [Paracoccaceae bacterium]